jgi:hypothetical protein
MKLLDILNEVEKEEKPSKMDELSDMGKSNLTTDDIGKFFIVTKPSQKSTIDDIVFESDVFHFANQIRGGLKFEDVTGIYKQKSDARRAGTEALKVFQDSLKEMEDAMEAFRSAKKDIEEKKSVAKEKIQKLKQ